MYLYPNFFLFLGENTAAGARCFGCLTFCSRFFPLNRLKGIVGSLARRGVRYALADPWLPAEAGWFTARGTSPPQLVPPRPPAAGVPIAPESATSQTKSTPRWKPSSSSPRSRLRLMSTHMTVVSFSFGRVHFFVSLRRCDDDWSLKMNIFACTCIILVYCASWRRVHHVLRASVQHFFLIFIRRVRFFFFTLLSPGAVFISSPYTPILDSNRCS